MDQAKVSAKEWQKEIDKSRRRWMTLLKVAAGAGLLLLGGMVWPDGDRDDADRTGNPTSTHDTKPIRE